ncbi:PP2C family protein-serine/threonine phosphatase [Naasia sp. SYSU D00948]|uniref:PP2C family protein-serine/threonine phosphatase n=1 Tax=Naasia sp. SYSU D00948 TaxID=2817379 RepID=UPI001B305EA2|nr:SpoIIE family protein phosphatase [Naasia sp. SYSU D00948]
MLDALTLRVAFAVAALTLLLLFFFVTFRGTRSRYSLWWCIALALFLTGSSAYLLDGTEHQVWANPLGNVLLVAGAVGVWSGARSLRRAPARAWWLAAAPLVTLVASVLDHPATNDWSGGPVFLASMSLLIGLSSRELLLLDPGYSRVRWPLVAVSGALSVYYALRLIAFVTVGPRAPLFTTWFGTEVTTLVTMVLLVVVSFGMAGLSGEQLARDLTTRATRSSEELAQAAEVQRSLLPQSSPAVPGYEISGAVVPSRGVSGDFFDWQRTDDGLALTVADVMGKGLGAAMIAATTRAAVRGTLPHRGTAEAVGTLSSVLSEDLTSTQAFVTLFHARLCVARSELTVTDAGHGLGVILRADGSDELMSSQHLPLGVVPDQEWRTRTYRLGVGDLVLVFSDGVLDLFDGSLDSLRQAADLATRTSPTAAGAVGSVTALASRVSLDDDVTVVAIRRTA